MKRIIKINKVSCESICRLADTEFETETGKRIDEIKPVHNGIKLFETEFYLFLILPKNEINY